MKTEINEVLCEGCGTCVASISSASVRRNLIEDEEIFVEIERPALPPERRYAHILEIA